MRLRPASVKKNTSEASILIVKIEKLTKIPIIYFQLDYWTSASMTKGVHFNVAQELSLSSEYSLKLISINDGLIHRPRSNWTIEYTNCQVNALHTLYFIPISRK